MAAHTIDEKKRTTDILNPKDCDFETLLLSPHVLGGLKQCGFVRPSPIQLQAIPLAKCGVDLVCQAKSGTGKTCVFAVCALETVNVQLSITQVLVLSPTREIAHQIYGVITSMGCQLDGLHCGLFIGGIAMQKDMECIKKCHIAIGTPGRIRHLIEKGHLSTSSVRLFVLDEADKLLEKGSFEQQINWIYSTLPSDKQVLALSATYPEVLANRLNNYMLNSFHVRIDPNDVVLKGVIQYYVEVRKVNLPNKLFELKCKTLIDILGKLPFQQCMVFSNYHSRAEYLCQKLNKEGWPSTYIAGSQVQSDRLSALMKLKEYNCRILITTDLTARGIDCDQVNLVINLDLPWDAETYFHRVGRAGRFGSYGMAISLVSFGEEKQKLMDIAQSVKSNIQQLPDDRSTFSSLWKHVVEHSDDSSDELNVNVTDLTADVVCDHHGDGDSDAINVAVVSPEKEIFDDEKRSISDNWTLFSPDSHNQPDIDDLVKAQTITIDDQRCPIGDNSRICFSSEYSQDQPVVDGVAETQTKYMDGRRYPIVDNSTTLFSPDDSSNQTAAIVLVEAHKNSNDQNQSIVGNSASFSPEGSHDQPVVDGLVKAQKNAIIDQRYPIADNLTTSFSSECSHDQPLVNSLVETQTKKTGNRRQPIFDSPILLSPDHTRDGLVETQAKNSDDQRQSFVDKSTDFSPESTHDQTKHDVVEEVENEKPLSIDGISMMCDHDVDSTQIEIDDVCGVDINIVDNSTNQETGTDTKQTSVTIPIKTNNTKDVFQELPKYLKLFDRRRKQKQNISMDTISKSTLSENQVENRTQHNLTSKLLPDELTGGTSSTSFETPIQLPPDDSLYQEPIHFLESGFHNHEQNDPVILMKFETSNDNDGCSETTTGSSDSGDEVTDDDNDVDTDDDVSYHKDVIGSHNDDVDDNDGKFIDYGDEVTVEVTDYDVTDYDDDIDEQHSRTWNQELLVRKLQQAYHQHINTLSYYKHLYYDT